MAARLDFFSKLLWCTEINPPMSRIWRAAPMSPPKRWNMGREAAEPFP